MTSEDDQKDVGSLRSISVLFECPEIVSESINNLIEKEQYDPSDIVRTVGRNWGLEGALARAVWADEVVEDVVA